jgi:hypothetical protein
VWSSIKVRIQALNGMKKNSFLHWSDDDRHFSFHHNTALDSTTNYTVRILGTASDDQGGTLDGNINRSREGSPADDFVWTLRFAIPNDDFQTS